LTASLTMATTDSGTQSSTSSVSLEGLSPSHSDSSPEDEVVHCSSAPSPELRPASPVRTLAELMKEAQVEQSQLATTMAAVDRRTRLQRLRLHTYLVATHAATHPGTPLTDGPPLELRSTANADLTLQNPSSSTEAPAATSSSNNSSSNKRRSPAVSPEIIIHDAKRVHRHLVRMGTGLARGLAGTLSALYKSSHLPGLSWLSST
jgi:hypothetical protein